MARKYRSQSKRYEDYKHQGKKPRTNWRTRRYNRKKHEKAMEGVYRYKYRSILGWLFARRRRKDESLKEYRLRLINLELCSFIIILLIIILYLVYN